MPLDKTSTKQRIYSQLMRGKSDKEIYNSIPSIFTSIKDVGKYRKEFNAQLKELNQQKGTKVGRRKGVKYKPLPAGVGFGKGE